MCRALSEAPASTIPASGVWRELDDPERPTLELLAWNEPWPSELNQRGLLQELAQADVNAGFAEWFAGDLSDLKRKFGDDCAAGKLGIVEKPGAPPRLIGDSTVSHANCLCCIAEKIELCFQVSCAGFRLQPLFPSIMHRIGSPSA